MPSRIQIRIFILTPIQIRISIRIWIGIKTMPIHMQILPQVLHMLENGGKYFGFILFTAAPVYNIFFFSQSKCVMFLSIFDKLSWKN